MTSSQRVTEVVCLLKLKGQEQIGNLHQILYNNQDDPDIHNHLSGLLVQKYTQTLKEYTHSHTHHHLSAFEKMDLIRQILGCLQCIHQQGIAHRDISDTNFMVDEIDNNKTTKQAKVTLIDFGRATLAKPSDVYHWYVGGTTRQELEKQCMKLPLISTKPDQAYWCYRSIKTLPLSMSNDDVLPWLVDPVAEDMYSVGVLIWKLFTNTEPWHGLMYERDLTLLRQTVGTDKRIEKHVKQDVVGPLSRQLLFFCLRTEPKDRLSAKSLLAWLNRPDIASGLMDE
ncbi:kinase-like domain-containing protein, partial [Chlamydoabsidia padenii]